MTPVNTLKKYVSPVRPSTAVCQPCGSDDDSTLTLAALEKNTADAEAPVAAGARLASDAGVVGCPTARDDVELSAEGAVGEVTLAPRDRGILGDLVTTGGGVVVGALGDGDGGAERNSEADAVCERCCRIDDITADGDDGDKGDDALDVGCGPKSTACGVRLANDGCLTAGGLNGFDDGLGPGRGGGTRTGG